MKRLLTVAIMALLTCPMWAQEKPESIIRIDTKDVGRYDAFTYFVVVNTDLNSNEKTYGLYLNGSRNGITWRISFNQQAVASLIKYFQYITTTTFDPPAKWEKSDIVCYVNQSVYYKLNTSNKHVDLMYVEDASMINDIYLAEINQDEYKEFKELLDNIAQTLTQKGCNLTE